MSSNLESSPLEKDNYVNEEEVFSTYEEETNHEGNELSLEGFFDDGFGDMNEEPRHVVLEKVEDIWALENTYNIDIASIIERKNQST